MPDRNSMSHFAVNPEVHIERSRFEMNNNIKFTGNVGKLIPFYLAEVLPGDTFDVKTSFVARLQTLIHPIMDNMFLDTYYFFVPNRLIWDNWKKFCGEPDRAWTPTREYTVPQAVIHPEVFYSDPTYTTDEARFNAFATAFKDTVLDYLGFAITKDMQLPVRVNALPLRAYQKIYDDWFRDENLQDPVNLYTGDNDVDVLGQYTPGYVTPNFTRTAGKLHDYFTSALPQPQRGDPVTLSANFAGGSSSLMPVGTYTEYHESNLAGSAERSLIWQTVGGSTRYGTSYNNLNVTYTNTTTDGTRAPVNLWTEMTGDLSLGITINDLRLAFQVQKFMEKSARGGARYIELIKTMFGVDSPDARLQRSEYLGGHRVPIVIHQVVNQSESQATPLGNVGAMSLTTDTHDDFVHSFTEHGFVIGICVCRYRHSYSQGVNRLWLRRTKFDYYWPVFASIGEQPIRTDEIYYKSIQAQDQNTIFGYQEAWADYRYMPDRVAGEMRPGVPNTLSSWHLGDYYDQAPTLHDNWIQEDKTNVDRTLAVTSLVSDQLLFDFYVQNTATRPMPVYSIPGLVDHF